MIILIDNGHGENTKGKCSPDRSLLEYEWTREVADIVKASLSADGIDCRRIVLERSDISLTERCKRVNNICRANEASNVLLVSIHCNAAPPNDGKWHSARGWSVFVGKTASAKSKALATHLAEAATHNGFKVRKPLATQPYWVQGLTICQGTNCPAVLVENFFMDNKEDCAFLLSKAGKLACANTIVRGIREYCKSL